MGEYVGTLGSVLMMIAIANIIIPEGGLKKFASVAMGFMIIVVVVAPLGNISEKLPFDEKSFQFGEQSFESAKAQYKADILSKHKENITKKINEKIKHGSRVFVDVSNEGELARVSIVLKGDESAAVKYIVEELGLPRERINLNYENN